MSDSTEYQPIDCELHDHYESACVLKQLVNLRIDGAQVRVLILDIVQQERAEYLKLDGYAELIRLDRIEFLGI